MKVVRTVSMSIAGSMSIAATVACLLTAAGYAQTLTDLGRLPGGTYNIGGLLSDNGAVACGNGNAAGTNSHAWRWTAASGLQDLGASAGADHSYAYGISGDGLVIVGASGAAGSYDMACRWSQATGMQSLGSLASGRSSFASDVSTDGSIVFGYGYEANLAETAFIWTATGGMRPFGQRLPGTSHSVGLAMTGDGAVYIGYCFNNAPALVLPTAVRWTPDGTVSSLGAFPGRAETVPSDLNLDGSVIVGYAADAQGTNYRAFRWTVAGGMQDLGMPAGCTMAVASAVTGDGSTIVGYAMLNGQPVACIWNAQGPQLLETYLQSRGIPTAGWSLRNASISTDGAVLIGTGLHNGVTSAWSTGMQCDSAPVITQQPVPQTVTLGASASFTVIATGAGITYQWFKDASLLPGQILPTLLLSSVTYSDAANYHCVLTSPCGQAASSAATLTVQSPCHVPVVTEQPHSVRVAPGSTATFAVAATSETDAQYQWRRNGFDIAGATLPVHQIVGVTLSDVGSYSCLITNPCGGVLSDYAMLSLCSADFNHDGAVDFFDYLDFVDDFSRGFDDADFNKDDVVDFFDYLDFVDAFSQGCS